MLVLSRHRGETIRINDDIIITLVDIRGDRARIGVDAPAHIRVDRQEVWEQRRYNAHERKIPATTANGR